VVSGGESIAAAVRFTELSVGAARGVAATDTRPDGRTKAFHKTADANRTINAETRTSMRRSMRAICERTASRR